MSKENQDTRVTEYWLVKLGNLFYVGGLPRTTGINKETKGLEFANEEKVAFPFLIEEIAMRVADEIGGVAVKKELSSEEIIKLQELNEAYINSEKNWYTEQYKEMEHIRNEAMLSEIIKKLEEQGGIKDYYLHHNYMDGSLELNIEFHNDKADDILGSSGIKVVNSCASWE